MQTLPSFLEQTAETVRETVYDFAQRDVASHAYEIDHKDVFPRDL